MPKATPYDIVLYVSGLLTVAGRATCTRLARKLTHEVSHDTLTRTIQTVHQQGQTLLLRAARRLAGSLTDGYLIVDDTVIQKAFAACIDCLGWMYSSKERRSVKGLCVVVLMWSNSAITVPLAFRLWRPKKKKRTTLALELLKWAKRQRLQPRCVLFDSFFSSKKILKWVDAQGWYFVSQVKKNRKLNGLPIRRWHRHPYWTEVGTLEGGLRVRIAKHGRKYFVTNEVSLTSQEMRAAYKHRWGIEEAFRLLHDQLGMDDCQAQSALAQRNHIRFCCLAYTVLLGEAQRRSISPYQLKDNLIFARKRWDMQFVKRLLELA